MNVYVSTDHFGLHDTSPIEIIRRSGCNIRFNKLGRKPTENELLADLDNIDVLIAGTEKISRNVIDRNPKLRLISRVGIGLDGLDLEYLQSRGVKVTYTPDAPTIAVAELIVGLILDNARKISYTSARLKAGKWHRHMGMLLREKTIGVLGFGRIGKSLAHLLRPFNSNLIASDLDPDYSVANSLGVTFTNLDDLLSKSDVVCMCVPLNSSTLNLIDYKKISLMKKNSILVNTARGGIVNEHDLSVALKEGLIDSAAIDVFENEPYKGPLQELSNCTLTCHMGASTIESRIRMETEAAREVVSFVTSGKLLNEVKVYE